MRLASFIHEGRADFGAVIEDQIAPFGREGDGVPGLRAWLAADHRTDEPGAERIPLADVTLLPPVPDAGKIFCVATNFHEPSRGEKPLPDYPLLFTRFADSFVGHGVPILLPPETQRLDFEGEVAVIIGRPGRRIPRERAMEHVAGYTCLNDGSVRDWQKHSPQFTPGKNFWRSGACGPWMVTADEVPDPSALRIETRVNGEVKQAIGLDRFIFDIPWLIAYLSTITPLAPGDIIATGTSSGFGSTRQPPEFLSPGDVVEVQVSGIGTLENRVEAEV